MENNTDNIAWGSEILYRTSLEWGVNGLFLMRAAFSMQERLGDATESSDKGI